MAEKRHLVDADPDYEDYDDGSQTVPEQRKRQKVMENDGKEVSVKKIQNIVSNEFDKEILSKEIEIDEVDKRLYDARSALDRLRACIVASYYNKAGMSTSKQQTKAIAQVSGIHPATKRFLGKTVPAAVMVQSSTIKTEENDNSEHKSTEEPCSIAKQCEKEQAVVAQPPKKSHSSAARGSWLKVKKRIIVGNVSRYIPMEKRDENDQATHKWMVYVRGTKEEPSIDGFVEKVWFFLHPSYRPNDLVEIGEGPFHLTRRGWGEFPIRVQLHFKDKRNKRVDIIHILKLDRTYTGLQTLGSETVVDVELEREKSETISKPPEPPDKQKNNLNMKQNKQQESLDSEKLMHSTEGVTICHNVSPGNSQTASVKNPTSVLMEKENIDSNVMGHQQESSKIQKPKLLSWKHGGNKEVLLAKDSLFELSTPLSSVVEVGTPERADSVSSGFQDLSCHSTPESTSFSSMRGGRVSVDSLPSTPESFNSNNASVSATPYMSRSSSEGGLKQGLADSFLGNKSTEELQTAFQVPSAEKFTIPSSKVKEETVEDSSFCKNNYIDAQAVNKSRNSLGTGENEDKLSKKSGKKSGPVNKSPDSGSRTTAKYIKLPDSKGRTILVPENLFLQLQTGGQKEICINISPAAAQASTDQKSPSAVAGVKSEPMKPIKLHIPGLSLSQASSLLPSETKQLKKSSKTEKESVVIPHDKSTSQSTLLSSSFSSNVGNVLPLPSQGLVVSTSQSSKPQMLISPQVKSGLSLLSPRIIIPQAQRMATPVQGTSSLLNTSVQNTSLLTPPQQGSSLLKNITKPSPQLVIRTPNGELKLVNSISPEGLLNLQPVTALQKAASSGKQVSVKQSVPNVLLPGSVLTAGTSKKAPTLSKGKSLIFSSPSLLPSTSGQRSISKSVSAGNLKGHIGKNAPTVRELLEAQRTNPPSSVTVNQIVVPTGVNQKMPTISLLRPVSPKANTQAVIQKINAAPVIPQLNVQKQLSQKSNPSLLNSAQNINTTKTTPLLCVQTGNVQKHAGVIKPDASSSSSAQRLMLSLVSQVNKVEGNTAVSTTTSRQLNNVPSVSLPLKNQQTVQSGATAQSLLQPSRVKSILKRHEINGQTAENTASSKSSSQAGGDVLPASSSLLSVVKQSEGSRSLLLPASVKLNQGTLLHPGNLTLNTIGEKHLLGLSKQQWKKTELHNNQVSWRELVQRQLEDKAPRRVKLPNYRIESFDTFEDLVRIVVRHFPMVDETPDRVLHPYCTSSVESYLNWNVGKRRAAELSRVVAMRRAIIELLGGDEWFKTEKVWCRRRLILWCRRHGYTPFDKEISSSLRQSPVPFIAENYNSYTDHSSVLDRLQCTAETDSIHDVSTVSSEEVVNIDGSSEDDTGDDGTKKQGPHFKSPVKQAKGLEDIILPDGVGASFIRETCSQIGIRIKPDVIGEEDGATLRGHMVEEVLLKGSFRFAEDILRKAISVIYSKDRLPEEISAHEIFQALNELPQCDFLTNKTLGVMDDTEIISLSQIPNLPPHSGLL